MRVAALVGLARRMQRIAEEDQAGEAVDALRRDVRRDAAAHRLAADEQRQPAHFGARLRDRVAPGLFEHRRPVGHAAPRGHVREVERGGDDAPRGQPLRGSYHERAVLSRARAVCHHQRRRGGTATVHFQFHANCILLSRGAVSFSVPVTASAQRLPPAVTPLHYDITVTPSLAAATFGGTVDHPAHASRAHRPRSC